jgi:hypothetical protein
MVVQGTAVAIADINTSSAIYSRTLPDHSTLTMHYQYDVLHRLLKQYHHSFSKMTLHAFFMRTFEVLTEMVTAGGFEPPIESLLSY